MKKDCLDSVTNDLFFDADITAGAGETSDNELTIIDALDRVQEAACASKLTDEFWQECSEEIEFLCRRLDVNRNQAVLLSIMSEIGEAVSWRRIGKFLGLSRLKAMSFTPDIDNLKDRRWIYECAACEPNGRYVGFKLVFGVINAFRHNQKFQPEKIDGLSEQVFIDRLTRYVCREGNDSDIQAEEKHRWMLQLASVNMHLPVCHKIMSLEEKTSQILLLLELTDYAMYGETENEGLTIFEINSWFDQGWEFDSLAEQLQTGRQELFAKGILEHGVADGLVDTARYILTSQAKNELLAQYEPHRQKGMPGMRCEKDIIKSDDITEKQLFYNPQESAQIARLKALLDANGYKSVCDRLSESGMRRGITCLFYGSPGTGKTESVIQLARETGRNIMQVDLSSIRDKYVGESEKNIKTVFSRYRDYCKSCENTPILLFNEADAIINSRLEAPSSSVEKMDNAIQNIILQEFETLEGILIATTNFTGTLDKAFDRRFLFKIEFSKPGLEAKKSIWHNMMPHIDDYECHNLASSFDFSGGQIENIARKCMIDYAITGQKASLDQIRIFCQEETLSRKSICKVGF